MVHLDQLYVDRNGEPVPRRDAAYRLVEALSKAVEKCSEGADKLAVQLSGGLDSAIIQALARCENLYCCTWVSQDNLTTAKLAALGFNVKPVTFTRTDMLDVLPDVARLTDGRGTWSQVCQYMLGKAMADDGVDVVLNGEGADELFGGYSRYRILYWLDRMFQDPLLEAYDSVTNHIVGCPGDVLLRALLRTMSDRQADFAVNGGGVPWHRGLVGAMAAIEGRGPLNELISYERTIAKHHGIEHRWPFMDLAVVGIADSLKPEEMVNEHACKVTLRKVAGILGVHRSIIDEKTKRGLFIPQSWRPEGAPMWSRDWFDALMREAYGTAS